MSSKLRGGGILVHRDDTRKLEDDARRMEAKLDMLRSVVDSGDSATAGDTGGRWRCGSATKPLTRNYVKGVLDAPSHRNRGLARRAAPTGLGGYPSAPPLTTPSPARSARSGAFNEGFSDELVSAAQQDAVSKLQTPTNRQSKEALEVEAFLTSLNLDRYISIFMENGFDCMEVVEVMGESHMREIGMASGHVLKLSKKLSEMRPPAVASQAQNVPPAPPRDGTNSGRSLWEGRFNEDESAASFQESLRAWRKSGDASTSSPKQGGTDRPCSSGNPGTFWASMGSDEIDFERVRTPLVSAPPPHAGQSETATDAQGSAPGDEKLCCYNCYKQFFAKYAVERQSPVPGVSEVRRLCSEACADKWSRTLQAKLEVQQKRQQRLDALQDVQRAMDAERTPTNTSAKAELFGSSGAQN